MTWDEQDLTGAFAAIRVKVLDAIKDRDIAKYDEVFPGCMGDAWDIVRATEWLCEQIKLKGVKLYVETGESLWRWGLVDDDGLTSLSYGECKPDRSHLDIAAHTLVSALSYVRELYGKYELYIIDDSCETYTMAYAAQPHTGIEEELAQLVDELNLVVYTGTQEQVRSVLRDIAAK